MALVRDGKQRAWWKHLGLPYATYVGYEAEATSIGDYNPDVVPGLLQVEGYARTVFESGGPPLDPPTLEARIKARIRGQALLAGYEAPLLHCIIDEGALRHVIGGRVVIRAQLARIKKVASLPSLTFQVIPFEVGAHPGLDSNFVILEIAEPTANDVVYVDSEHLPGNASRPREIQANIVPAANPSRWTQKVLLLWSRGSRQPTRTARTLAKIQKTE
jgi:hypothetical protein